jgi:uncharacterized protein YqhQ
MPGFGAHRFYFVEKVPLAFTLVLSLLFANTLLMFLPPFAGEHFPSKRFPLMFSWYDDHSILIQFVLLGMLAAILAVYRKRVRYVGRK